VPAIEPDGCAASEKRSANSSLSAGTVAFSTHCPTMRLLSVAEPEPRLPQTAWLIEPCYEPMWPLALKVIVEPPGPKPHREILSSIATTRIAVMPAPTFEQISMIVSSRTPTGTPAVAAALFSMDIAEEPERITWAAAVKPVPAHSR